MASKTVVDKTPNETTENSEPKISPRNVSAKDDDDITFNFFYDIVKKLILKRNDVGGKMYILNIMLSNKNRFPQYIL